MPAVLTLTPATVGTLTLAPVANALYPSATTYPGFNQIPGTHTLTLTPA